MDVDSGRIVKLTAEMTDEFYKDPQKMFEKRLVPITDKQAKEFKPLSRRKRKFLLRNGSCFCGSGKSFKKCCYPKYKRT